MLARQYSRWLRASTLTLVATSAGLIGCSSKVLTVEETDVALTFKDEDRNYSQLRTFYVPDEVVDLCDVAMGGGRSDEDVDCSDADHKLDKVIISELRKNMQERGYREVDPEEEAPDVAFYVGSVVRDNWYMVSSPGYCYGGYYWWYYGCYYPGYSYAYNLPTASILIEMAALDKEEEKLESAWTAVLSGLYEESSDKSGSDRVADAMKRAFDQSPYLASGGER